MSLDVYLKCGELTCYEANYTHNCNTMADEAGIYKAVWRPDENGIDTAAQLVPILETGIALMESDPPRFIAHNPPNGWGDYDSFLIWLKEYLAACKKAPDAKVRVSR